jgi:hypothetical protein
MAKLNESNIITINLSSEKYPLIKTVKSDELNNFVNNIFDHGYKMLYPNFELDTIHKEQLENMSRKEILESINYLREDINDMELKGKIENLSFVLEKFLGLSQHSNKKGEISEDIIHQVFTSKYKDLSYEKTRHVPHSGDGILIFPSKQKTLVEIKNYTATVNKEEVNKFKYDMKFNNIYFGLFISIKSSIQGHSQLSYEKMIHDNKEYHMVFISHIDHESSKIDAALLVLNRLFELENKSINTNLSWLHQQINSNFKELVLVSERTSFLKDSYIAMEGSIKNSLNDYYKILRDYQYEIKKQINMIWNKMNDDFGSIDNDLLEKSSMNKLLDTYKEDKCYTMLSRIFDIFQSNQVNLEKENDKTWNISYKDINIGETKKSKNKLIVNLIDPLISLSFVRNNENEKNYQFLNIILSNLK